MTTPRPKRSTARRQQPTTRQFLQQLGLSTLPARTCPFDPGYDPATIESHLAQSHRLMSALKISMACWLIADEQATRAKICAAHRYSVPVVTGGGPFEIAVALNRLEEYLELCQTLEIDRIECGTGFTEMKIPPTAVVKAAARHGLAVQFEVGKKHAGQFDLSHVEQHIAQGREWLDAGAEKIVVEARESAAGVGLFDAAGNVNEKMADRFAETLGLEVVVFEAPTKKSQFALLNHFGDEVELTNVRIEELLRVEIYRRHLHSDAFDHRYFSPGSSS